MKDLENLTGETLVQHIRKTNRNKAAAMGFADAAFAAAAVLITAVRMDGDMDTGTYVVALIILGGLMVYMTVCCWRFARVARDPERAKLFRKYGTPDDIAAQIAAGMGRCIVNTRKAYVTDTFIMHKSNIESFIPYSHAVLAYKKEHSTNGIKDGVFLTVHDVYGDSFDYPFPLSKKKAEEMDRTAAAIAAGAPMCRFGYTGENLSYAKSVKREIPERN